jgi:hypothetical protein
MMCLLLLWLVGGHELAVLVVDLGVWYGLFLDEAETEASDDFIAYTVHLC